MGFLAALPAIVTAAGSLYQANSSKNTAKANQSADSSIDNQLVSIWNAMTSQASNLFSKVHPAQSLATAGNFYRGEIAGGLDPAVKNAATSAFETEGARGLSAIEEALGPSSPNPGGLAKNWQEGMITGNVGLQQQLAALNQATKQQGAAGLAGVADSALAGGSGLLSGAAGGLAGLGSQFNATATNNATNATNNNPFAAIGSLLASLNLGAPSSTGSLGTPAGGPGIPAPPPTMSGSPPTIG